MSSDIELLELAAKAAGVDVIEQRGGGLPWTIEIPNGRRSTWNPLTDDGDALRLAVKLHICAKYDRYVPPEVGLPRECGVAITDGGQWFAEAGPDPCAATRRAIVSAAASIGKAMP